VNQRELDRNAARRLAIIRHAREVTGNVAQTCRYYGISRQVFYVWYRRYEAEGLTGLRDRSTRPLTCPHETPSEVAGKIIYLRTSYHFGPAKISMHLKRYHGALGGQTPYERLKQKTTATTPRVNDLRQLHTETGSRVAPRLAPEDRKGASGENPKPLLTW
jgi:hypothetical protein